MLSLTEHWIINKYIFHVFRVNANAKSILMLVALIKKHRSLKPVRQLLFIYPYWPTIYALSSLIKYGQIFTRHAKKPLEDYISLTRVDFNPQIKTWCDWCSIFNGYMAFLIDSINMTHANDLWLHLLTKDKSSFIKIKLLLHCFNALAHPIEMPITIKTTPDELFPSLYHHASGTGKNLLQAISNTYNRAQAIEKECCPFQHMRNIAILEHTDKERYNDYLTCENSKDLIEAGKILLRFKYVKCHECVDIINTHFDDQKQALNNIDQNLAQQFLDIFCRLSQSYNRDRLKFD